MKNAPLLLLALLFAACGDTGKESGLGVDNDGDGYETPEDCDDADDQVNPDASEVCDGVDNDCNGFADEDTATDATTWYEDADGDGYGADATSTASCTRPGANWVEEYGDCDDNRSDMHPGASETNCEDPTDYNCDGSVGFNDADGDGFAACLECDDSNADVNPDAIEVCDGIDNDCANGADVGATDDSVWYIDYDSDLYGTDKIIQEACDQPDGFVGNADDCDDVDPDTYPGATELCDGKDNDCDATGDIDEGALGAGIWYADSDGDTFGDPGVYQEVCGQPEGYVADNTDCDDANPGAWPGAVETCNVVDDDCDGVVDDYDVVDAPPWYIDYDHDNYGDMYGGAYPVPACTQPPGYAATQDDCDDRDANTWPAAPELCDSVDNDCDSEVDEDPTDPKTWYADLDSDDFGDSGTTLVACNAGAGWTLDSTDCDDGDDSVFPGAAETCNSVDDDCDGTADEDPADPPTWYVDADGDGHGNSAYPSTGFGCASPTGDATYAAIGDDCDDTEPTTYPGALEYCNAVDDNCNGDSDEGPPVDAPTWYMDNDGDGFADPTATKVSCNQPTDYLAVEYANDCIDTDSLVNPGATEACNDGIDNNCDGLLGSCEATLAESSLTYTGAATSANAGYSLANLDDMNGDGYADIAISTYDASLITGGSAYVVYGPFEADGEVSLADIPDVVRGEVPGDKFGYSMSAGDLTGDDIPDLLVGAPLTHTGGEDSGTAYIAQGPVSGAVNMSTDAYQEIYGALAWDRTAFDVLVVGDMNSDGDEDFILSAWAADSAYQQTGLYYLMYGPMASGVTNLDTATDILNGEAYEDRLGDTSAAVGDLDGDGNDDFVLGCEKDDSNGSDAGAIYIVYPPLYGEQTISSVATKVKGVAASDLAGSAVAAAGDTNGDGYGDIWVGAKNFNSEDTTDGGRVFLLQGPVTATTLSEATATISGSASSLIFGNAIEGGFDYNADDALDVAVSATSYGSSGTGAVYLFYGPIEGNIQDTERDVLLTGETGDGAGTAFKYLPDRDGTGQPVLFMGAPYTDIGYTDAGRVYALFDVGL